MACSGRGYVTIVGRKRLWSDHDALTDWRTRVGIELLGQLKTGLSGNYSQRGGGGGGGGFHPIFFACQNLPKVLWALRDYCTTAVWHYGTTALRLYGTTRHYSIMALRHYGTTGSFRINVKSKMAFMGINFHKNLIFGVVLECLHRDILMPE